VKLPAITIITPSLNQGHYIEDNILSVKNQHYPDVEHLIIDGGSVDKTLSVLQRFEKRLKWISELDKGQSDAVNKGFMRASGEIIGWINADDFLLPGALYKVADFFCRYPKTKAVIGDLLVVSESGEPVKVIEARRYTHNYLLNEATGIIQPSMFFRRVLIKKAGYLDTGLNYSMDYDFFLRITLHSVIEYLPETLAAFRKNPNAKTSRGTYYFALERLKIRKRYGGGLLAPAGRDAIYIILTEPLRRIVWVRCAIRHGRCILHNLFCRKRI